MSERLKERLHCDKVNPLELMQVLSNYFGGCTLIPPSKTVFQKGSHTLEITADSDGQIEKMELSSAFPHSELAQLEQRVASELLTEESSVGQAVLFCSPRHLDGFYRYGDLFQIVPVPGNAPALEATFGEHPLLLQFQYNKSTNVMIDAARRQEKAVIYTRLLNLLCNQNVRLDRHDGRFHWTLEVSEKTTSGCRQEGYVFDGIWFREGCFTDTNGMNSIKAVPVKDYYSRYYPTAGSLTLPDNLNESLKRIFSLSQSDYDRFFRASTWYEIGQQVWRDSKSSAFVSFVAAIETLAAKKESSVTRRFREFLRTHVSDLDEMREEANLLYSMRSSLAHGGKLLQQDLSPWNFWQSMGLDEHRLQMNLFHITGVAIYNWLWSLHE